MRSSLRGNGAKKCEMTKKKKLENKGEKWTRVVTVVKKLDEVLLALDDQHLARMIFGERDDDVF